MPPNVGEDMYTFIGELYPICRSITGDGVRETLRRIQSHIPIEIHEVPSGTKVFDWTVPKEWNIRDAYVKDSRGQRVIDFQASNLHVVSYSLPFRGKLSLRELRDHLHTLPEHPDWIPYRTSYYHETWGFCISHNDLARLTDDEYNVLIDSSLESGNLSYGECVVKGQQDEEVLLSCHICHPSLCNDNLSGIAMTTFLARYLSGLPRRHTFRFLFIPGTIGAITWLSLNEELASRITHGLVVACVGDGGKFHYKKSRRGNAEIDIAVEHVLKHSGDEFAIMDFSPYGYDERQFCSPGFNMPVGSLTRTPHGRYPEYHTSADNLSFVSPDHLTESFDKYLSVLFIIENNLRFLNLNPKCEPQLGKRGLYGASGGRVDRKLLEMAMLWVLNCSDGSHTLLDIAEKSGMDFITVWAAANALREKSLLKVIDE